ncbi:MAG: hypothetical protein E7254_07675 [Lachnospiraceae bacterium]|nr:hypothetical protein [Lachnospiraceae bacterium]
MLIEEIQKSIKDLKRLDKVESAVQDAEKKNQNDADYSAIVADFWRSIKTVSLAHSLLSFDLSDDSIEHATDIANRLEDVVAAGAVDEEELKEVKQQINRKFNPSLTREWKDYYLRISSPVRSKIATVGSLVQDQNKLSMIKNRIANASEWTGLSLKDDGNQTRLDWLKMSIDEVDKIEEELNLTEEIKNFVIAVTRKKAKVVDITPSIIEWINEEKLGDNFVIEFKKI